MLTERQQLQVRRQICSKYGFEPNSVKLTSVTARCNLVTDDLELEVDFVHQQSGFFQSEKFILDISDMRKMPVMVVDMCG